DYEWSSAKAHMTGKDDRLVTVKPLLERFGDWESYLSQRLITRELDLIEKHERSEKPIGSREFVSSIEEMTGLKLTPGKRGPKGPRKKKDNN
ncbi:MAG: transposase, partial [Bacillota bacterium]|nr:transposase [Bacillota bacterium]